MALTSAILLFSTWRGSAMKGSPSGVKVWSSTCAVLRLAQGTMESDAARGAAIAVLVAGLDVKAGLGDLAAPHVEPVQRHREIDAFLERLLQRIAGRPFAAHDAIGVDQQELDGLDVGMFLDEGAVFALVISGDEARWSELVQLRSVAAMVRRCSRMPFRGPVSVAVDVCKISLSDLLHDMTACPLASTACQWGAAVSSAAERL